MTRDELIIYLHRIGSAAYTQAYKEKVMAHDDEQRRVIEQQAKRLQELEEWQKIVTGTGTDQEAVARMAATEYTKVAVQCWKEKCEQQAQQIVTLKSELSQRTNLEGSAPCWNSAHMKQIVTLREALQGILEIGKRDMTNPKYDGYFEQAKQAIKEVKP